MSQQAAEVRLLPKSSVPVESLLAHFSSRFKAEDDAVSGLAPVATYAERGEAPFFEAAGSTTLNGSPELDSLLFLWFELCLALRVF